MYGAFPYAQKHKVAEAVGAINRYYSGSGKNLLLMTPGRIGTSSPELGVPVSFADISCFGEICPDRTDLFGMVTVREPESLFYWLDSVKNHAVCGIV